MHQALLRISILIQKKSVVKVAFSCRGVAGIEYLVRPCVFRGNIKLYTGVVPRVVVLVDSVARAVRSILCPVAYNIW